MANPSIDTKTAKSHGPRKRPVLNEKRPPERMTTPSGSSPHPARRDHVTRFCRAGSSPSATHTPPTGTAVTKRGAQQWGSLLWGGAAAEGPHPASRSATSLWAGLGGQKVAAELLDDVPSSSAAMACRCRRHLAHAPAPVMRASGA
eukprot:TRINITY_DN7602_c0_g1_i2.p4 TRINITY_DN7602_c0_g1~~TRINITY_DN7602_c0_g1_i2.p4  ORF type:complete len:146 (+),score=19.29 TRINITY_DN7602_c0_g1_i2:153-590(+)